MKKEITKVPFNDFVYDIETTPYHTILVRRNGVVAWSSNCSSDNVKGVPIPQPDPEKKQRHIAEKGAINYLLGKTKPTTQAYKAIKSKEGKEAIIRNKDLVVLPFKGTPEFKIRRDRLSMRGLKEVCKKYGFKSIEEDLEYWSKALRMGQ